MSEETKLYKKSYYLKNKETYLDRAKKKYSEHSRKVKERKKLLKLNDIPIRKK